MIKRNAVFTSVLSLILQAPGLELSGSDRAGDPAERYWRLMNEGHDVRVFEPIAREATRPENRAGSDPEFNARRTRLLDQMAATELRPAVVGWGSREQATPGRDWPTLGGNNAHTGATTEPGPTRGEEFWRFPVGYDYRAGVALRGDTVFAPSPGTGTVLYALERKSGNVRWLLRRPPAVEGLAMSGGGEVLFHEGGVASVPALDFHGTMAEFHGFDPASGRHLFVSRAEATEKRFLAPDSEPEPVRAYLADRRTAVAVKKIRSDRMWWKFPLGMAVAEPIIAGGLVFAAADDGTLWALNLDGEERVAWTFRIDAPWGVSPAVVDGRVFAGANDGNVYAVDASTGRLLWSSGISTPNPRARQQFSKAHISDGRVVIGSADGWLYCLDALTGRLRWRHEAGDWIRARPFSHGAVVVAATLAGEVFAVRDSGGSAIPLWRVSSGPHPLLGDVVGDAEGVLVTSNAVWVAALGLEDGSVQWRCRVIPSCGPPERSILADAPPQIHQAPPTVARGVVFAGGPDGFVHAIDASTGRLLWRFEIDGRVAAAPTVADGRVFIGEYLGGRRFVAVDAATGEPIWSRSIGGVWASPTCERGRVYVGTSEGEIYCLNAEDGAIVWSRRVGSDIYPAPAVNEHGIYFGSWDGHYYALDKRDGRLLWAWSPPGYPYHVGGRPDSAAPVLHDGMVIVPILGGRYVAIDARAGTTRWTWFPPKGICNVTATVHDGVVYVGTFGNTYLQPHGATLYALDAASGVTLWEIETLGGLTAPVITGAGLLVCGSLNTPYIEAYRLARDRSRPNLAWRLQTEGHMVESLPAVSGGLGFFLACDGWLRAVW